ncbi:MAG: ornithine carbamoyltransferase [Bdellovibrio sp.]|nr:MAG: ornithine carbamoyltransferase [Bdellovibrio sp.]
MRFKKKVGVFTPLPGPSVRHFLTGEEFSSGEIARLLEEAEILRQSRTADNSKPLAGKTVALIFEKPSLRTRLSFTVGVQEMGGHIVELAGNQKKSEDPEDAIRVLQGMVHGVMIRTFTHETVERMAHQSQIPIINGLTDSHHPCQALADLLTLRQRFGRLRGLNLAYIGDGNNVLHSLLLMSPAAGVNVQFSCPPGYQPDAQILRRAQTRAEQHGTKISILPHAAAAAEGAHALYTDVAISMGFESEMEQRRTAFKDYQINLQLLGRARPDCIVMHCLPMNKGEEITQEVVDHPRAVLFQQAENRLHAQKALMRSLFTAKSNIRSLRREALNSERSAL